MSTKKTTPSWSDVKSRLTDFDRAGLLNLTQDIYAASKENKAFLHARLGLGDDPLKPYKATIERWLWPNVLKNHEPSVANAKKAIADYRKAVGQPEGLAELMVYFCECAAGFSDEYGFEDGGYFDALVRMFEQALKIVTSLPEAQCDPLWGRLDDVRDTSQHFGYGVGDDMDDLLAEYAADD